MEAKAPIAFDIVRKGIAPVVYSMQGDSNTRSIFISLFNDSIPWQVPADVSIAVAYKKPDGSKGLYDKLPNGKEAITVSGSSVKAIFAPQMLTVPGEVIASVVFFDKDINRLSTFPFIVMVTSDPSSGKQVSNDYYKFSTMEEVGKAVDDVIAALEADKQAFLDEAAKALALTPPAIVCETTGSVIAVNDSSDRLLHGLTLYGKTTQDGTPTPENPVELVSAGASGAITVGVLGTKNIFGGEAFADKLVELIGARKGIDEDTGERFVTYNYADIANLGSNAEQTVIFDDFKPNTRYTVLLYGRSLTGSDTANMGFYHTDGTSRVPSFTTTSNGYATIRNISYAGETVTRFAFYRSSGDTILYYDKCGIFEGIVTEADFEPYKGQTLTASTPNGLPGIPVSSGGNYMDENGQQWICDEIDFAKGVYVQRIAQADMGTLTWYYTSERFVARPTNMGGNKYAKGFCSHYPVVEDNYRNMPNHSMNLNDSVLSSANGICVRDDSFTSGDRFREHVEGVIIIYELATPADPIQLSAEELAKYAALHSYKPNTTVYNDAGAGLSIDYVADTKMYIDNKLAAISAAVLNA